MKTCFEKITPERVETLEPNQIFVFGSNLRGKHMGGAAAFAFQKWGAEWGNPEGIQGQTYAIPTMDVLALDRLPLHTIEDYVDNFIKYATENQDKQFLVTEIGCGIAGFSIEAIAPLFKEAIVVDNIHLPERFWSVLIKEA